MVEPEASTIDTTRDPRAEVSMTTDVRDPRTLVEPLAAWLAPALGADGVVTVATPEAPSGSGMSSVTLMLDCAWEEAGQAREARLAVRLAPDAAARPVFPRYDLVLQHDVMAALAEVGSVPVPALVGVEPTGAVIGTPFLVMRAVEGRAPVDNPPYVFGGWLAEAGEDERRALQDASLDILARVHATDLAALPAGLGRPDDHALRVHFSGQRDYYAWTIAEGGPRVPLLERAFAWLEERWPEDSPTVLSWGDARPGNILYDGFTPVAALDWEMAALGPRELDVAWFIFIHRFFQDIAEVFQLPGLPDFSRPEDVAATYERLSGHRLRDLDWYVTYAALRHGIVMARIKHRMIGFGEEAAPADPDDYVMHRAALARLIGEG